MTILGPCALTAVAGLLGCPTGQVDREDAHRSARRTAARPPRLRSPRAAGCLPDADRLPHNALRSAAANRRRCACVNPTAATAIRRTPKGCPSRWASSRDISRPTPTAAPSGRTTSSPSNARPRLQPRIAGSIARLTIVTRAAPTRTDIDTHHHKLRDGAANQTSAVVATTATPGNTSTAKAAARIGQPANSFGAGSWTAGAAVGLLDQHRHLATWSSLEIRYLPSSFTIVTRKR